VKSDDKVGLPLSILIFFFTLYPAKGVNMTNPKQIMQAIPARFVHVFLIASSREA
jgi:hypothetical protein